MGIAAPAFAQLPVPTVEVQVPIPPVPTVRVEPVPTVRLPEVPVPRVPLPDVPVPTVAPPPAGGGGGGGGGAAPAANGGGPGLRAAHRRAVPRRPGPPPEGRRRRARTRAVARPRRVRWRRRCAPAAAPRSASRGGSGGRSSGARASALSASPKDRAVKRRVERREKRLRETVAKTSGCLDDLSSAQRRVLTLRSGVGAADPTSRRGVARRLDISVRRVTRLERSGLKRLRSLGANGGCAPPSNTVASGATAPVVARAAVEPPRSATAAGRTGAGAAASVRTTAVAAAAAAAPATPEDEGQPPNSGGVAGISGTNSRPSAAASRSSSRWACSRWRSPRWPCSSCAGARAGAGGRGRRRAGAGARATGVEAVARVDDGRPRLDRRATALARGLLGERAGQGSGAPAGGALARDVGSAAVVGPAGSALKPVLRRLFMYVVGHRRKHGCANSSCHPCRRPDHLRCSAVRV